MPNPEDTVPRSTYNTRSGITWQQILQRPSWISNLTGGGSNSDGSDIALTIDTGSGRVTGLANPINSADAANKAYVDAQVANANTGVADWDLITDKPVFTEKFTMVDDNTNVKLITNLDMNSARIRNVGAPLNSHEVTNKQYVDNGIATVNSKIDVEIADVLSDAKAYADGILAGTGAPDWNDVINKPAYLEDDGPLSMDVQGVLIVDTNMSLAGNILHNVANPALPKDAANKDYVDGLMNQTAKPADVRSMITESSAQDRRWTNITEKPTWVGKMDYIATPTTANPNGLLDNYIHVKTNVDMDGQLIAGLGDPTHASHAVPLRYLETKIDELQTSIDEGAATGVLEHITRDSETAPTKIIVDLPIAFPSTSRKRIRYVADPMDTTDYDYDAVNKLYVDTKIAAGGGSNPYANHLTVDGNELAIVNVKAPTVAKDASTKKYVDDRFTNYQPSWTSVTSKPSFLNPLSDGTYSHFRPIPMSSFMTIRNLADPTLDQDAATKSYVDDMVKLIEASRGVLSARTLFRPKVTFTNSVIGDIDYASIVAADRTKFGAQLNNGNYLSRSNIWITNVKVNISVFWGDDNDADLTDLVWDKSDEKVMIRNGPGTTNLVWDQTAATIRTSTAYTNKAVIVRMSPVIEAYALPSGSFHSFQGIDDYNIDPRGVYFTYTVPPSEVRRAAT